MRKLNSGVKLTSLSIEERKYLRSGNYKVKNLPKEYVSVDIKRKHLLKIFGVKIKASLDTDAEKIALSWPDITMQISRGKAMSRLMELTGVPLEEIVKEKVNYSDYYDLSEEKQSFVLEKIKNEISKKEGEGRFQNV